MRSWSDTRLTQALSLIPARPPQPGKIGRSGDPGSRDSGTSWAKLCRAYGAGLPVPEQAFSAPRVAFSSEVFMGLRMGLGEHCAVKGRAIGPFWILCRPLKVVNCAVPVTEMEQAQEMLNHADLLTEAASDPIGGATVLARERSQQAHMIFHFDQSG